MSLRLESLGQVYLPPRGSVGWYQDQEPGVQTHVSDTFNRAPSSLLLRTSFLGIREPLPATGAQLSASSTKVSCVIRYSSRGPSHRDIHVPSWGSWLRELPAKPHQASFYPCNSSRCSMRALLWPAPGQDSLGSELLTSAYDTGGQAALGKEGRVTTSGTSY